MITQEANNRERKLSVDIFDYSHIAEYLLAIYEEKHQKNLAFSIRAWARQLGMHSASLLSAVLRKERRVSPELAARLSDMIKLEGMAATYFEALVVFSGPRSPLEDHAVREYLFYLRDRCLATMGITPTIFSSSANAE